MNTETVKILLFYATRNSDKKMVKLLLNAGVDINIKNECSQTPLHIATHNSNEKMGKPFFGKWSKCQFSK